MSEAWTALHFLRPHAFWALLALPLIAWLWQVRRQRANAWRGEVDAHLLPHLLVHGRGATVWPVIGLAVAGTLAVLALAGPSWRKGEQPLWQQRAPLVIALDLSSATTAADLPPSRLLQARGKLATLLRERQGGQVGLVAFADDAFTVAPLTEDADNVALFLDALSPEVMPVDGQRADRAIAWSTKLLAQAGFKRGDVLLLTDHADASAQLAAAKAASEGYRVSVLGLGSEAGAAYRRGDGELSRARLDAGSLRQLAARGDGRFATVDRGDADLIALGVLDPASLDDASTASRQGRAWQDEGYWLLLPLMLLAVFAFRRGAAVAVCVLALAWSAPSTAAEKGGWWQRADQREHAQIQSGVGAYRRGDFAAAEQAFAGKSSADALYNHGNALAKQGRYDEAIAAYDAALVKQPDMEDAIANRAAVQRARKPSQGGGQGGQGAQDLAKSSNAQKPNPAEGSQRPSKPDAQHPPPPPPSSSKQAAQPPSQPPPAQKNPAQDSAQRRASAPPEAPKPADATSQQAADAAQRQRMQEALSKASAQQTAGQRGQSAVPVNETAEQRERRQALEAWLRRVPDDPGGLLKAKFELEQERRQRESP